MSRGEIHWVELPPPAGGHEQAGRRPAVIVQDDAYTGVLPTVLVVPLTGELQAARFAGTMTIDPTPQNGLLSRSVALVFQVRAIDKRRIKERMGTLEADALNQLFGLLDKLTGR